MTATNQFKENRALPGGVVRILPLAKTDAALVDSLRAGEPGAAEMLFDRYGPYVERLVVRVVGLDPEVPDLVHEVFASALEGVHGLRESGSLKGWIGSIAVFTARLFLRKRQTRRRWLRFLAPEELPETASRAAPPEVSEILKRTYSVLDALPTDERVAFALRFVEGMELTEIAQIAGVSLSTVKRRLDRAQKKFRKAASKDPLLREHIAEERGRRR